MTVRNAHRIFNRPRKARRPGRDPSGRNICGSKIVAALQEGVELVLGELRKSGAGAGLGMRDEAGRVLLHQAVQRGLLGAVACATDRGAIGGPLGLLRRDSLDGIPVG